MRFEAARAALVAIDLQRAFCAPDGSVARQGRDVAPLRAAAERTLELVAAARRAGMPVIWTRMSYRPDYADGGLLMHELRPNLMRIGALRDGTPDADFVDGVTVLPEDRVIDKKRYSAFLGTALDGELAARGIDCLLVAGVTTSMCVESTVRDAGQRDLRTFVVAEACGDFDADRHRASLAAMAFGFARVISIEAAGAALAAGEAELPGP
ncbi:MAG: cysteine hydrolase [Burkholderiales bacterium]|nr:MAG: cysteine hydrolase [Burkholderiales bacterium]